MSANAIIPPGPTTPQPTANDRFKSLFESRVWTGVIAATLAHVLLFQFFPDLTAETTRVDNEAVALISMPPEVEIPPPPEALPQPRRPVVAGADVPEDFVPHMPTFDEIDPSAAPPPPAAESETGSGRTIIPYDVPPTLLNRAEVAKALERAYPRLLRDAGLGGNVLMWFHIDAEGRVLETEVYRSSGHGALDAAATEVARIMEFRPALNMDRAVAVWVQLPVTFTTR